MKLNLACGYDTRKGYMNIDYVAVPGVDMVLDLNKCPYPFKSKSAEEILIRDSLEHFQNPIQVLMECHRLLKEDGRLWIRLPHFSYYRAFNPEHKTYWHLGYFRNFEENKKNGTAEQYELFTIRNQRIHFLKGLLLHNYIIEWIVNLSPKMQEIYESCFAFIFPASLFEIELRRKK